MDIPQKKWEGEMQAHGRSKSTSGESTSSFNETQYVRPVKGTPINISDLITDETIVLQTTLDETTFDPSEFTGRSTKFFNSITSECLAASASIKDMDYWDMTLSGLSETWQFEDNYLNLDENFKPAEEMRSQFLADELSWEQKHADIPLSKKQHKFSKFDSREEDNFNFSAMSIGEYFISKSENLSKIMPNAKSPPQRIPQSLIDLSMISEHESKIESRLPKSSEEKTSFKSEKGNAEPKLMQKKQTDLRQKSRSCKATAPTIEITSVEKPSPQVVERNCTQKESLLNWKENRNDKIDARETKKRSISENRLKELIPLPSNKRSHSANNVNKLPPVSNDCNHRKNEDTAKTRIKQQDATNCLLNQAFISPKSEGLINYEAKTKRILNEAFISPKNEASTGKSASVNCSLNSPTISPKNDALSKQQTVCIADIKIEGIQRSQFVGQPFICLGNIQKLNEPLEIELVLNNKGSQIGFAVFVVEVENFINIGSLHIVPQRAIILPNTKKVVRIIYKPKYNEIKKIQSLQREKVCLYTINVTTGDLAAALRVKKKIQLYREPPKHLRKNTQFLEGFMDGLKMSIVSESNKFQYNEFILIVTNYLDETLLNTPPTQTVKSFMSNENVLRGIVPEDKYLVLRKDKYVDYALKFKSSENGEYWRISPTELTITPGNKKPEKMSIKCSCFRRENFELNANFSHLFDFNPKKGILRPGQKIDIDVTIPLHPIPSERCYIWIFLGNEKLRIPVNFKDPGITFV